MIVAILQAYGETVVVRIDGEEFVGSKVTELAANGCRNEHVAAWKDFEVLRDGEFVFGFQGHPRELWALSSEMPLVEKLHRDGLASFSLRPAAPGMLAVVARHAWALAVVAGFALCIYLSVEAILQMVELRRTSGWASPTHTALTFLPLLVFVLCGWIWYLYRSGASISAFVKAVILLSPAVLFQTMIHGIRAINRPDFPPPTEVCFAIPAGLVVLVVYGIVVWRWTVRSDRLFIVVVNLLAILSSFVAGINE